MATSSDIMKDTSIAILSTSAILVTLTAILHQALTIPRPVVAFASLTLLTAMILSIISLTVLALEVDTGPLWSPRSSRRYQFVFTVQATLFVFGVSVIAISFLL